jgi:hypothetical protein
VATWQGGQRDQFIDRVLWAMADDVRPELEFSAGRKAHLFESPIEEAFYLAWLAMADREPREFPPLPSLRIQHPITANGHQYRLDLAIVDAHIAIELDGHEFHERTPEQVAQRNVRDADIQVAGWLILHFCGREVLRDPWGCATRLKRTLFRGGFLYRSLAEGT